VSHTNEAPNDIDVEAPPDSINELCFVGEFGFHRIGGPHTVSKSINEWLVEIDIEDVNFISGVEDNVGECAVLVADGEVIGGGVTTDVVVVDEKDEILVFVDQYAMGNDDRRERPEFEGQKVFKGL